MAARGIVGVYNLLANELGKGDEAMGCPDVAYLIMEFAGIGQYDAMPVINALMEYSNHSCAISTLTRMFKPKKNVCAETKIVAKQLLEAKGTEQDFGYLITDVANNKSEELEDICIAGLKRKRAEGSDAATEEMDCAIRTLKRMMEPELKEYTGPMSKYYKRLSTKRLPIYNRRLDKLQKIKRETQEEEEEEENSNSETEPDSPYTTYTQIDNDW